MTFLTDASQLTVMTLDIQRAVQADVRDALRGGADAPEAERRLRRVLFRFLITDCGYSCVELLDCHLLARELRDERLLARIREVLGGAMVRWLRSQDSTLIADA